MGAKRSAALLAACVGRHPNPVRAAQPGNAGFFCAALRQGREFNI